MEIQKDTLTDAVETATASWAFVSVADSNVQLLDPTKERVLILLRSCRSLATGKKINK